MSRGYSWLNALTQGEGVLEGYPASVRVVDSVLGDRPARFIAVVPDANNPFVRCRHGEAGLLEGWALAKAVSTLVEKDKDSEQKTIIVPVVDMPSQGYGRREEGYGIYQALAAASNAYIKARVAGHPVVSLIVGRAMSAAFLAHGYQAPRLIALNDDNCLVHVMSKESAARITHRTVEQLEKLSETILPMAYDIKNYAKIGMLYQLADVKNADEPTSTDLSQIKSLLISAVESIGADTNDLSSRFDSPVREATNRARKEILDTSAASLS